MSGKATAAPEIDMGTVTKARSTTVSAIAERCCVRRGTVMRRILQ
jgi:hypothetical protein